ncbi:protein Smaug isoform X2 [Eurosta solidaginis]
MKYITQENSGVGHPKCESYDVNNKDNELYKTENNRKTFSEQVATVTNFFESWNDCERTVVMYALLKRLKYSSLKFLQYAIDHALTQNFSSEGNLTSVIVDINANNPSYLQNLLNAYRTLHLNDAADALASGPLDKETMQCYGSDFQITNCDEHKLYDKKKEILREMLGMLPLLKPGNDDAKLAYLALIPAAVRDLMNERVPTELVQQIFSYMLIHPAISNEDRRSLNVWLRHLEDHLQATDRLMEPKAVNNYKMNKSKVMESDASVSSVSSMTSSSSISNNSASSSGNLAPGLGSGTSNRNVDWQTIAPPSKQSHYTQQNSLPQPKSLPDWSLFARRDSGFSGSGVNNLSGVSSSSSGSSCSNRRNSSIADQLCDNFNGINLNELGSSQNKIGLSLNMASISSDSAVDESSLVNGVAAVATVTTTPGMPSLFGNTNNPIINIMSSSGTKDANVCDNNINKNCNNDEHDTSFSKNGTEIIDFEPHVSTNINEGCKSGSSASSSQENSSSNSFYQSTSVLPQPGYPSTLVNNYEQIDAAHWSLDGKLSTLKTRRSNSLTTQAISTSSSSSNSSVITVNDNCSNSTENLAQFANKPRSFSLSIEHQRGILANSGSDTRLDDFKPGYIKFQTRNVGMSNIGLWLKSLRLHKYIDLFKDMTYEDMLCITEEYLQSLGVTKGASHKLSLCVEKLKDRSNHLNKLEQDLKSGQIKLQTAVEDLANMVLSPMKPVESVNCVGNEDNVALNFLKFIDMVGSMIQRDNCLSQDEESVNVLMWILDRSIHNEAFVNHSSQLKELKFKLSKLKMSISHKVHHVKNGSVGGLNKPRWGVKSRKCDLKNGSNDRINHRKNSNDTLNFSTTPAQQQHQHGNHLHQGDYDKFTQMVNGNGNGSGSTQTQYKSSSYPNFINNQHQQGKQQPQQQYHSHHSQIAQQQQQAPQQPQMVQSSNMCLHKHFPTLPSHQQQPQQHQQSRRSLNNLIVVTGGPQQPQKMIFKPGHGIIPITPLSTECQMRRTSLTTSVNNQSSSNVNLATTFTPGNIDASNQTQTKSQPQQNQTKKTMAAVVMVSSEDLAVGGVLSPQQQQPPSHLVNNNSSMLNNNLLCQQQQQQLQLLAAAAAAVGNSCRNSNLTNCLCSVNSSSTNSSKNNCCAVNNISNCSNCSDLPNSYIEAHGGIQQTLTPTSTIPILSNIDFPLNDKFPTKGTSSNEAAAVAMNDINSLDQLETLCLQMTEQAIN